MRRKEADAREERGRLRGSVGQAMPWAQRSAVPARRLCTVWLLQQGGRSWLPTPPSPQAAELEPGTFRATLAPAGPQH